MPNANQIFYPLHCRSHCIGPPWVPTFSQPPLNSHSYAPSSYCSLVVVVLLEILRISPSKFCLSPNPHPQSLSFIFLCDSPPPPFLHSPPPSTSSIHQASTPLSSLLHHTIPLWQSSSYISYTLPLNPSFPSPPSHNSSLAVVLLQILLSYTISWLVASTSIQRKVLNSVCKTYSMSTT